MNNQLKNVWEYMRELGLAALAHVNRHAAYFEPMTPMWSELSILQAAYAAEIIFKARIAQEHPLLIFDNFPKIKKIKKNGNELLTIEYLFDKAKSIDWSDIQTRLWATTGLEIPDIECYEEFGRIRNGIQHFAPIPKSINTSYTTLKFVFKVIDPFIHECWGLYAIDYDEDYDSYEHFLCVLIRYEIPFLVSPEAAEYYDLWKDDLKNASKKYQEYFTAYMKKNYNL